MPSTVSFPRVRQHRPPPHPSLPSLASTLFTVSSIIAPHCLRLCCSFFPATLHSFSPLSPITNHDFQASCKSSTATLYCCHDSAFLCSPATPRSTPPTSSPPATLPYPSTRSMSKTPLMSPARLMSTRMHGRREGRWRRVAEQQGLLLWLVLLLFQQVAVASGGQVAAVGFSMSRTSSCRRRNSLSARTSCWWRRLWGLKIWF